MGDTLRTHSGPGTFQAHNLTKRPMALDLTVLAAGASPVEAKPLRDSQRQQRTVTAERGSGTLPQPQLKLPTPTPARSQAPVVLPTRQREESRRGWLVRQGQKEMLPQLGLALLPFPLCPPLSPPTTLRIRSRVSELQVY